MSSAVQDVEELRQHVKLDEDLADKDRKGLTQFCPNAEAGCIFEATEDKDLVAHASSCDYRQIKCVSVDCDFASLSKDLPAHLENDCQYVKLPACTRCHSSLLRKDKDSHSCMRTVAEGINAFVESIRAEEEMEEALYANFARTMNEYKFDMGVKTRKLFEEVAEPGDEDAGPRSLAKSLPVIGGGGPKKGPFCPNMFEDHVLKWYLVKNAHCGVCGKSNMLSRWRCEACNESYCVICIKPPLNGYCGVGHQMIKKNVWLHRCELCLSLIMGNAWVDQQCEFEICFKLSLIHI
eukprot:TRINITY_DN10727_c0_g1_i10.p1 TRINITY_DN10727_c0_g1~~TRINITY_DN10727_c0_g1_i10.p1  ORF type:complete len:293 (-),score=33.66 TRINITY_DN10727_c0_g1_i10:43-921(-)